MKSRVILLAVVSCLLTTTWTQADWRPISGHVGGKRLKTGSGEAVLVEVVVRPLGLASTVLGGALYVVTWPFAKLSGDTDKTKEHLINRPAEATFRRPIGNFDKLREIKDRP